VAQGDSVIAIGILEILELFVPF